MVTAAGISTIPYASLRVQFAGAARLYGGLKAVLSLTLERVPRFLIMRIQIIAIAREAATMQTIVIIET